MTTQRETDAVVLREDTQHEELAKAAVTIGRRGLLRAAVLGGLGVGVLGALGETLAAASPSVRWVPTSAPRRD